MRENLDASEDSLEHQENMSRRESSLSDFPKVKKFSFETNQKRFQNLKLKMCWELRKGYKYSMLADLGKGKNFSHAEMGRR